MADGKVHIVAAPGSGKTTLVNLIPRLYDVASGGVLIDGKELNSYDMTALRQKIGVTMPELHYVKKYRQLGGEILTIGSDAHCVEDLGKGINEGVAVAKAAGFKEICYFEKRQPKFIAI